MSVHRRNACSRRWSTTTGRYAPEDVRLEESEEPSPAADEVKVPGSARGKEDAIREAGGILVDVGAVTPDYIDAMFEREKSVSTYMGNYLAIPHGTNESKETIKRSALSVVRYDPAIDWDGNEVRFAIGIAGYEGGHMEILSKVAILFSDTDEVDKLIAARSSEELYELLNAVNEE